MGSVSGLVVRNANRKTGSSSLSLTHVPLEQAVIFLYRKRGYKWSSKQDWGSSSPCDAVGEDGRSQLTGNWSFGATATLGLVGLRSDSSLPVGLNQKPSIAPPLAFHSTYSCDCG